ncbi:MAG: 50S ribosomal protein L5 [SAR324 cluster bacterium]|nr:50S ribosomal protein L5 [SAR324 cluster bacterium]
MSQVSAKGKDFLDKYRQDFLKKFKFDNINQAPKLDKVVINVGAGEAVANPKCLEFIVKDLSLISGQKPVLAKAKKSIAGFKTRTGVVIGVFVTLRAKNMSDFLDRLINVAIPRIRDFRGVSNKSFDGHGNYTLGLREQLVFTEIDFDKTDKVRGLSITFVTTAKKDEHAKFLLEYLGMPFRGA